VGDYYGEADETVSEGSVYDEAGPTLMGEELAACQHLWAAPG
jgi:hypothetical protein